MSHPPTLPTSPTTPARLIRPWSSPLGLVALAALAAIACASPAARGQDCGNPPTNVFVGSGVCTPLVRVSWTNPLGLVFPKVWRGTTPDFGLATLVYNPGLLGATQFSDSPPAANTFYYYWVGGDVVACPGGGGAASVPKVGPMKAGVFTVNSYPPTTEEVTCSGVRVSWGPSWDATSFQVIRVGSTTGATYESIATLPAGSTSFLDTTARPGNSYYYAVFPAGVCGSGASGSADNLVLVGPWSAAAATSASVNVGAAAQLTVSNPVQPGASIAVPEPAGYTWAKDGIALLDNLKYQGTHTPTLTIANARLQDAGVYTLTVHSACGNSFSVPAVLSVTQPCRADFNQSGSVSVQDVFDFLSAFFAGCP